MVSCLSEASSSVLIFIISISISIIISVSISISISKKTHETIIHTHSHIRTFHTYHTNYHTNYHFKLQFFDFHICILLLWVYSINERDELIVYHIFTCFYHTCIGSSQVNMILLVSYTLANLRTNYNQ